MSEKAKKPVSRWQSLPEADRRRVKGLLLILALGVTLLCWTRTWSDTQTRAEQPAPQAAETSAIPGTDQLQSQLEAILGRVKGAGAVRVAVWYSAGATAVYATESQAASDQRTGEGQEQTSRDDRVTLANLGDQPVLVRQETAEISGVVVVAEGAGDPRVQERLYAAVKSLLGLRMDQIAVIEGERSDV